MGFAKHSDVRSDFTRRHYVIIADALHITLKKYKNLNMEWAFVPIEDVIKRIAYMFEKDNSNFKEGKFLEAVWRGINEKD